MPGWRAAASAAFGGITLLAACQQSSVPPKLTLRTAQFGDLTGWTDDNVAAAIPAFVKSCQVFLARGDDAPLDPQAKSGDFGTVGEWRGLCAAAARLPGTDAAAREYFAANFVPVLAANRDDPAGLFTGYFEIALNGSRRREGPFRTPIYRPPPDPAAYSRAEIEDGALGGKGLELVWVDDPIGAYFLQVQGSGLVRLQDGSVMRLGYAGANGRPYVAIGKVLVQRGDMQLSQVTMDSLRAWIASHGDAGAALMRENPSYVFFKDMGGDGPVGSEDVVLTAQRSLAVDRAFIPLGVPIWLDAKERFIAGETRRLVVAQDTGGAIKGPVRGDLFWGSDNAAAGAAGAMNAMGRYYLLLPRAVAPRAVAALGVD
jgi:membrane-bound lytic murein transglycosylase A